ncbi:MAG: UDP-4-amino-4,6-dideoxy-N-acetyl-beta-L-altrosamine transaminase, partial [Burkholderiales bacterium PBB4]
IESVIEVLRSEFLTQGPKVPEFEKKVASYCGAAYAVAANSATSALHIACAALGVGVGDWVWTSPISFVASANCALYCGARVDFVDIDPRTYNMSVSCLAEKLERAPKAGVLPKLVIPVHLGGQSCEMAAISQLANQYGFRVIEDASHAIGGSYAGAKVGGCQYSDITVFSFHPVKVVTTGEGGMALTNDPELVKKMARLRSHGITRYPAEMTHAPDGPWYYQQIDLGFNYRITDLQAALGISQMNRIDGFVESRHSIARRYDQLLEGSEYITPWQHPDTFSGQHLYILRIPRRLGAAKHQMTFEKLRAGGVGVNLHYIPIYRQPYFEAMGFSRKDFPNAENYYAEAISLPMFPDLTEDQQDEVVRLLQSPTGYQTLF